MAAQAESAEALLERYKAARQATYFPEQAREPQASGAQKSGYSPSTLVDIQGRPTEKPYTYQQDRNFEVNMNTGALSYEETDLSLPGINGLDLNFVRRYNTEDAQNYFTVDYLDGNAAAAMAYEVGYELYPLSAALTKDGAPENADLSPLKITNVSAYTFSGEPDGKLTAEPKAGTDPNAVFTKGFTASEAKAAEELYASLADSVYLNACRDGVAYRVQAQRYLRTIEPAYSTLSYTDLIPDNECVKKFGLGQGWTLGFSHIDEYPTADGSAKYLISAEGRRYKVQFTPYPGDSNLEDYTLEDMRLENNGNGYPGASYTLFHKDGKREYFNAAGLNIAIVDRFDNAITLAYTFSYWSEFSSSRVTRINITDTVGRQIVYQEEASGPWPPLADPSLDGWRGWVGSSSYSGFIPEDINEDMDYNCKWTLSVDNHVVREYYINNLDLILPPSLDRVSLRTLVGKERLQTLNLRSMIFRCQAVIIQDFHMDGIPVGLILHYYLFFIRTIRQQF